MLDRSEQDHTLRPFLSPSWAGSQLLYLQSFYAVLFDSLSTHNKRITPGTGKHATLRKALCALYVVCAIFFAFAADQAGAADEDQTAIPITTTLPISIELSPTDTAAVPSATHEEPPTYTLTQTPIHTATQTPTYTPTYAPVENPTEFSTATATPGSTETANVPGTPAPTSATETVVPTETGTATETATRTNTGTATLTPTPTLTATSTPAWLPPGPECVPEPGPTVVKLDVPYMHQVIDFGSADGNWACGPTSVAMVLAYYGKLEPWDEYVAEKSGANTITPPADATHSPTPSKSTKPSVASNFSPYVTSSYMNNGHTYSATARDPRGNYVAGLYGTISPTGFADWSRMEDVITWHGLSSRQVGVSWDGIVAALKRGHPVLIGNGLTAGGHILVAIGYTANGQLLVNDPYGNRFAPGYGGTSGKSLFYPWKCMRARNALEIIGTYPPPPRPTHTPLPTATITATVTSVSAAIASVAMVATGMSMQVSATGLPTSQRSTSATSTALSSNTVALGRAIWPGSRSTVSGEVSPKGGVSPVISPMRRAEPDKGANAMAIGGSVLSAVALLTAFFGLRIRRKARADADADAPTQDDPPL